MERFWVLSSVNNMIKQTSDSKTFLEICDKLEDVPDCKLNKKSLYSFMIAGEYNLQTFVYASYDDNKMNGCSVLHLTGDMTGSSVLIVIFQWLDPHYRKLWKDYMRFIEGKAKKYHCQKISFTTSRSEKAIDRQMGEYGYKKVYNVIEKEVV